MRKIKFSHIYPKLWKQTECYLILVRTMDKGAVNKSLQQYDTLYDDYKEDGAINIGYYELPNTKLLQLIFIGNFDIPFCTLRRYTPEKEKYYESSIGHEFQVVIEK